MVNQLIAAINLEKERELALIEEYANKPKGAIYERSRLNIAKKIISLEQKLKLLGTEKVWKVVISIPVNLNNMVSTENKRKIFWSSVEKEDAILLTQRRYPKANIILIEELDMGEAMNLSL